MKKLFTTLALAAVVGVLAHHTAHAQSVGINTTPAASAALDVSSTTKGMLVPRMTTAQRNAIASPATGLMVYDITLSSFYFYNGTAWAAVGGAGGTTLPSQTGNAGKYLKTDGANLSWGTVNSFELNVTKTASEAQTTSVGSSLSLPDVITFTSTNGSNAALTSGNTWDGSQGKFTVGSTGAGLYFVDVQMGGDQNGAAPIPMLDWNGTGNSGSSYYGIGYDNSVVLQSPHKARGTLQRLVFMNANDYFIVRAASRSAALGNYHVTDGSTYIKIVKLR